MVMAYVQLRAGNIETALDFLDEVLSIPSYYSTTWIENDPVWSPARNHSLYKELISIYKGVTF